MLLADGSGFAVVRRIVPADNSCLFSSFAYVTTQSRGGAQQLRQLIAETVAADPETYNEAFLGKTNAEYCAWILRPDSWGGAIELSILGEKCVPRMCVGQSMSGAPDAAPAHRFSKEICAADIQTKRIDRYGQARAARRACRAC